MKNYKVSILFLTVILSVFLSLGNILAQSGSNKSGNDNTGNTTTDQDRTSTSQTNGNSNYQQDQNNTGNQGDEAFQQTAQQLANDLVTRLNLGQDKTKDITDILVDYRNNIADAMKDNQGNSNQTGMTENNSGSDNTGQTGMSGNDNGNMTGSNNSDYMKSLQKADKEANDKIESKIGKENVAQYINVKKDWWRDVKDRVYASVNSSSSNTGSDMMNNGTTGSGKKGSKRSSGTNSGSGTGMGTGTDNGSGTGMGTGSNRGTGTNKGTGTGTNRGTGTGSGTTTDTTGSNRSSY